MNSLDRRAARGLADRWLRTIATGLVAALMFLLGAPSDIERSLPGSSAHRVTRGGPRLELADVFVHDVDLSAPPGDLKSEGIERSAISKSRTLLLQRSAVALAATGPTPFTIDQAIAGTAAGFATPFISSSGRLPSVGRAPPSHS